MTSTNRYAHHTLLDEGPQPKTSRSALIPEVALLSLPWPPPRLWSISRAWGLIIIAFLLFLGGSVMTDGKGNVGFHPQAKGVRRLITHLSESQTPSTLQIHHERAEQDESDHLPMPKRILPKHPAAGLATKPGKPQCRRRCCGRRLRLLHGVTFGGAYRGEGKG